MLIIIQVVALGILTIPSCLALGPAPVALGSAANFAILAKTGVSTVPSSAITGDIGLSPTASTSITGFSMTTSLLGTSASSLQVTGSLFATDFTIPTPSLLNSATGAMLTALNDAAGRTNPTSTNLGAGGIGGLTLGPGLYKWTSAVNIGSGTTLTLSGTSIDTWIFQISGTLTTASATNIILQGGALARNIVWVVSGAVTLGSTSHFEGIILGALSVTLNTGATMNGRLLTQTAVVLQQATVVSPL